VALDRETLSRREIEVLRRLLQKHSVLEGMIDEYEQIERRKIVFRDLFHDARALVLGAFFVLQFTLVAIGVYAAFFHR